jgi:hypothetical protein
MPPTAAFIAQKAKPSCHISNASALYHCLFQAVRSLVEVQCLARTIIVELWLLDVHVLIKGSVQESSIIVKGVAFKICKGHNMQEAQRLILLATGAKRRSYSRALALGCIP